MWRVSASSFRVSASVERHVGGLRVGVPLAVAALEAVGAFQFAVLSVQPGHGHPLRGGVHPVDGRLQRGNRLADVVVHNRQIEEVPVQLAQHLRLLGQSLQAAVVLSWVKGEAIRRFQLGSCLTHICYVLQRGRRYEHHIGRELGGAEYLQGLGLHIQYGHLALGVNPSDGVQLGAVHGILMGACKVSRNTHELGLGIAYISEFTLPYSKYSFAPMSAIISSCETK